MTDEEKERYKPARDARGRILPGHTANPDGIGGKKKMVRDRALEYCPEIIDGMFLIWKDPTQRTKDRMDAGNAVLLRGMGHPHTVKEEQAEPLSLAELERALPRLIQNASKPYDINDEAPPAPDAPKET